MRSECHIFKHRDKFAFQGCFAPTPRKTHARVIAERSTEISPYIRSIVTEEWNGNFTHVFPSQSCFTALAINVGNCVKSCQQNTFFCWTATNIHSTSETNPKTTVKRWNTSMKLLIYHWYICGIYSHFIEQVSSALATLERLK